MATSGASTRDAAELAANEVNARGGLLVGKVRYRIIPDYGDIADATDVATAAAQVLLTRPEIVAIVGPQFSRAALPVANLAENAHVPMITPMGSHPAITAGRQWVFRIAFTDDFQAGVLARWARGNMHASRAAILVEESAAYSRDIATRFDSVFTALGGRVVAREGYTRDQRGDFADALRRVRATNPDVLLLPNELHDDTLQMRQARDVGITASFVLPDFVDSRVMGTVPAAQGLYTTHQWHTQAPGAASRTFLTLFDSVYHRVPSVTSASTYDAFRLLFDAMQRAGSTNPDSLRTAIAATRDFPGVTGTISYHGRQDPVKPAFLLRLDQSHLTIIKVVTP